MTQEIQHALDTLRRAGYVVVAWTPDEVGEADEGTLEEIATERGNIYLAEFSSDEES